jgi:hypothetical protein
LSLFRSLRVVNLAGVILLFLGALKTGLHSGMIPHLVYRSLPLPEVSISFIAGFADEILKRRFTTTKSTVEWLTRFVSEQGLLKIH